MLAELCSFFCEIFKVLYIVDSPGQNHDIIVYPIVNLENTLSEIS